MKTQVEDDNTGRHRVPRPRLSTYEDRIAEAAAVRREAFEALEHAKGLEHRLAGLQREVGQAWQKAYGLADEASRLQRDARPHAALEAEEARLLAELKNMEEGDATCAI